MIWTDAFWHKIISPLRSLRLAHFEVFLGRFLLLLHWFNALSLDCVLTYLFLCTRGVNGKYYSLICTQSTVGLKQRHFSKHRLSKVAALLPSTGLCCKWAGYLLISSLYQEWNIRIVTYLFAQSDETIINKSIYWNLVSWCSFIWVLVEKMLSTRVDN